MPKNSRKFMSAAAAVGREPDHIKIGSPLAPEPYTPGSPGGMWHCQVCSLMNRARRTYCRNCSADKPRLASLPLTPANIRSSIAEQISNWLHLKGLDSPMKRRAKSRDNCPPWEPQLNGSSDDTCVASPIKSAESERSGDPSWKSNKGRDHSPDRFSEPEQTVIIFDWDDTLFPTTEFFDEWRLSSRDDEPMPTLSKECEIGMQKWRDALLEYLTQACSISNCVAIVTNSRRPWVDTCINRFCPNLKELFARKSGGPLVVYADELVRRENTMYSKSMDLRPVRHRVWDLNLSEEEWDEQLTAAKYAAIKLVVKEFYSQYPNQTWKNVISLGDMMYEHDATREVTFKHGTDGCRTKTIIVPTGPSLSEITLRLRFSRLMLPEYVCFDGDIDLDLQKAKDPLEAIAKALHMEELAKVSISRHAWGKTKAPQDSETNSAILKLAETLDELLVARRAREAGIRWYSL